MAMTERRATDRDVDACVRIVHALPDYFTDDVPAKVRQDLASHGGWVVTDDDAVMGFAVAERRSATAEIRWIAVDPARRGSGLGTRLLRRVLADLRGDGVVLVEVKTLDGSVDYAPYGPTRAFWERRGFLQIDTVDPLPGWRPGNPCAFYVAALAATV
ncbi:GNAT family N-acetyltransferase [Actinopolymorpha pittospori]